MTPGKTGNRGGATMGLVEGLMVAVIVICVLWLAMFTGPIFRGK